MSTVKTIIGKIDAREIRRKLGLNQQQQSWSTLGATRWRSTLQRLQACRSRSSELLRLVHVEQGRHQDHQARMTGKSSECLKAPGAGAVHARRRSRRAATTPKGRLIPLFGISEQRASR